VANNASANAQEKGSVRGLNLVVNSGHDSDDDGDDSDKQYLFPVLTPHLYRQTTSAPLHGQTPSPW
jgi:hypothetical protein